MAAIQLPLPHESWQVLASSCFKSPRRSIPNPNRIPSRVEGYRSAIAALVTEGLIDPKHVGVVRYCWTRWYVTEALVKAPSLFKAAAIADGFDSGNIDVKLWSVGDLVLRNQITRIFGSTRSAYALQNWADVTLSFQADGKSCEHSDQPNDRKRHPRESVHALILFHAIMASPRYPSSPGSRR